MKIDKQKVMDQTRESLFNVFRYALPEDEATARRLIEENTHFPENDPGEWAPRSIVVIHAEGVPLPYPAEARDVEEWFKVSEGIDGAYVEHINGAVAAVYEG